MSVKLVKQKYVNDAIESINLTVPKMIGNMDTYKGTTYTFVATSYIPVGDLSLPPFTTGIVIEQIGHTVDAIMMAVDPNGKFYVSYRNGQNWQHGRVI